MWRTAARWAVPLILIIFLPVALLGLIVPIDDYRAQGIVGAVDCDGPGAVMLLVVPSLVVYAAGAAYYAAHPKGSRRSVTANVTAVLCALMMVAAGGKTWAAYREMVGPEHRRACGEGR